MATLADLLAVPSELEFEGTTYKITEPTLIQRGLFQRWLEQRARESVDRAVYIDDAAQTKAQNALTRDIAAGLYEWGGEVAALSLQTATGVAKLLEILFGIDDDTARRMAENRLKQIAALIAAVEEDDPKVLGAILAQLGLPKDYLSSSSPTRRSTGRSKKSATSRRPKSGRSSRKSSGTKTGGRS